MRSVEHVGLWLMWLWWWWWVRLTVEGWLRRVIEGREGGSWWRVRGGFFFVIPTVVVVGVSDVRVMVAMVEGELHG